MDDIFSYIIYAIIIISFLSSFLKKKEPVKQNPMPKKSEPKDSSISSDYTLEKSTTSSQSKSENFDILKELEKVFNSDFKIPEPQKPQQTDPYDDYRSTAIKDKDLSQTIDPRLQREVEDYKPIGYRPTFDNRQQTDTRRISSLSSTKQATDSKTALEELDKSILLSEQKSKKKISRNFAIKLKSPATLKEYILFLEILGKPKALRR